MAFLCEPVVETRFKSLKDVDLWLSASEDRLERVSIGDWIEKGARFFDDEYFGDDDRFLRFNPNGIRALVRKLNLRPSPENMPPACSTPHTAITPPCSTSSTSLRNTPRTSPSANGWRWRKGQGCWRTRL